MTESSGGFAQDTTFFGKPPEILASRSVTAEMLAAGGASGTVPVGVIAAYYGASAPTGWLLCNGASFSAGTYPDLAALLGGTTLPDLRQRFPMGKAASGTGSTLGGTGGSKDAIAVTHNHPQDPHNHIQDQHAHGLSGGNHKHAADTDYGNRWGVSSGSAQNQGWVKGTANGGSPQLDTALTDIDLENILSPGGGGTALSVSNQTPTNQGQTATNQAAGSSGTDANLPPWLAINYIIRAV